MTGIGAEWTVPAARTARTAIAIEDVAAPCPAAVDEAIPLSCRVFQDFVELDGLRAEWDEAVLRLGGNVYMTYDWLRTWWEFYGKGATLRLFVFRTGDRIVAILPIYIDALGWGPVRFRVARLVGANIPPKVFGPPVPHEHSAGVLAHVFRELFAGDRCDLLSLGPVSELEEWKERLETACTEHRSLVGRCITATGVHSVFHLPADMEEYYGALSKNERKNRRKYELRLLKKEYDTRVEVLTDPVLVADEFERFAEQHRQQWLAEGKTGHFGAWPRGLEFNRALVEAQATLGRLRFIRILANDQVIANQYVFAFGNRYYWELPSRVVDPMWERFSLGPTAIVTMLAQGIAEGIERVEGGLAHYDYKVRLGAKEYAAQTFCIVASTRPARARFALYSLARDCMAVAYHKMWYRRVMPRLLPVFWRPQSRLWLRLDF